MVFKIYYKKRRNNKLTLMIKSQTYLNIADNTGARKIMCIQILGNNKKYGNKSSKNYRIST